MIRIGLLTLWAIVAGILPTQPHSSSFLRGQEVGFLEQYALSTDRSQVLKNLIPGTQDYYYFHSLYYQTNEQFDKVDEFLKLWIKRYGVNSQVKQIQNRQAFLRYSENPKATLEFLENRLSLRFDHARRIPQAEKKLPSKLKTADVDEQLMLTRALRRSNLDQLTDAGLRKIAFQSLSRTQRRYLLQRVTHPDFPNLVPLIVGELLEKDSRGFGSLSIHRLLTIQQLDQLKAQVPAKTLSNQNFVNVYLSKLSPGEDVNLDRDQDEKRAHLNRLNDYVDTLNPTFNSLKASVLYRLLELDLNEGKMDRQKFIDYLRLPRSSSDTNPELLRNVRSRSHVVQLGADYSQQTMLNPIRNDRELVQKYLQRFFLKADGYQEFLPYLREPFLKLEFATTKILNGIGDVERWASLLTPTQYETLLKRIDIDFDIGNGDYFADDSDVVMNLHLKNVNNLIVKIFEVNTGNYYRKHQREIDTDINLDGIVPNHELSFEYSDPPAIRHTEKFSFPQLERPGVYIVDFIAGGKSSRALIRKGSLRLLEQVVSAGQTLTVLNGRGENVDGASVWIQGTRYNAQKNGKILIPFSSNPGIVSAVITHGDFSSIQRLKHLGETYLFQSAFLIDRESLIKNNTARILVRPSLKIAGGNPVSVTLLQDVTLTLKTTNLEGNTSVKTIRDLELSGSEEAIVELDCPPRLRSVDVKLSATLKRIVDGKEQKFSANKTLNVNEIDNTKSIQAAHLVPTTSGYFLEIRGKSGEPRPRQPVRLSLYFVAVTKKSVVNLESDEFGRVELGKLPGIRSIGVEIPNCPFLTWDLASQNQVYESYIHAQVGQTIELPAPAGIKSPEDGAVSLTEVRRGQYIADYSDRVVFGDGSIQVSNLDAGDYLLRIRSSAQLHSAQVKNIKIKVADGMMAGRVIVNDARELETRGTQSVQVPSIGVDDEQLVVQLKNSGAKTRVHVLASRYQPAFDSFTAMSGIRDSQPWYRKNSFQRSVYMEGRKIGDEYEYILRRRYLKKYPGNMLQRPSLLLNPWDDQTTSNQNQTANAGDDFDRAGVESRELQRSESGQARSEKSKSDFANLDFLGTGSKIIANLRPDEQGRISLDLKKLGDRQNIRILVCNATQTVQRSLRLPAFGVEPKEAGLADGLDPASHFSQSKKSLILNQGQSMQIQQFGSATFQQY
ncbi:MAG: hypothetical protein AAF623_18615, partial [Planctomycetota bacterium]